MADCGRQGVWKYDIRKFILRIMYIEDLKKDFYNVLIGKVSF